MTQIGNATEVRVIKSQLEELWISGFVKAWEIPYEYLLTRRAPTLVFLTPTDDIHLEKIWAELRKHDQFKCRPNDEKRISQLAWRIEFNDGFDL